MTNRLARMMSFGTKPRYRLISLDLENASEAIEIARKLAERSGQKVARRDLVHLEKRHGKLGNGAPIASFDVLLADLAGLIGSRSIA